MSSSNPIDTSEQDAQAQQQIEFFARRVRDLQIVVEAVESAFAELDDWPEAIGEAMSQLTTATNAIANDAFDWARQGNADFVPRHPFFD